MADPSQRQAFGSSIPARIPSVTAQVQRLASELTFTVDVSQTLVATLVEESQPGMVQAQEPQQGGLFQGGYGTFSRLAFPAAEGSLRGVLRMDRADALARQR